MKAPNITTILFAIHCIGSTAQADLVLVQHTFMGSAKTPMVTTMSIKGNKMRTDNDANSSVIMDATTGDMTTLIHESKMVIRTNAKQLAALTPKDSKISIPETKVESTGQKETVDGHECEIYLSTNSGMTVKMWIANDFPNHAKLKEALKPMSQLSASGGSMKQVMEGMMLKSEYEQNGIKFTTKHVSLKEQPIAADLFAIPTGYKAPGE